MASLLKHSEKLNSKKRKAQDDGDKVAGPSTVVEKKRKDKVLLLSSRGVTQRMRHLIHDLEALLPHTKKDSKLDSKSSLHLVNELADLHNCNNALYFEARRHEDLYMWASRTPNGPSIKCHVQNIHTMDELKLTGNCLKGSRGIVVFDGEWESKEEWRLLKEVFGHIFSVPRTSRRLKPFIDHIILLSILDGRIWFRNYQIIDKDPLVPNGPPQTSLVEIGPRFVLNPIRVFEGSFGGPTVYANQEFVSPAATRASLRAAAGQRYKVRKHGQDERAERAERYQDEVPEDELARDKVFA